VRYTISFKYRFELLIPLADNEGNRFASEEIRRVRNDLLKQFGGCRSQPMSPYIGSWVEEDIIYHDELVMFTVDAPRTDESLDWFQEYKQILKNAFRQIEIYLAVGEVIWF